MGSKFLTPKQIAQTYVINDIINHELILSALSEVEVYALEQEVLLTAFDIIHRVCEIAIRDPLFDVFELSSSNILRTLRNEYQTEINTLSSMLNRKFATLGQNT